MKVKERATEILLARHAESKFNPERIYSSKPENDKGLTARGRKWANLLGRRLKLDGGRIKAIYSSHIPRCLQTAGILSKHLQKKIILNKNFREPAMGRYELMSRAEIEKKFPKLAKKWFYGDISNLRLGESMKAASRRAWKELEKLARKHNGQRILIVTHQAPIKFIACKLFGGLKYFNNFCLSNASLTLLIKKGNKFKLRYLNDISHIH